MRMKTDEPRCSGQPGPDVAHLVVPAPDPNGLAKDLADRVDETRRPRRRSRSPRLPGRDGSGRGRTSSSRPRAASSTERSRAPLGGAWVKPPTVPVDRDALQSAPRGTGGGKAPWIALADRPPRTWHVKGHVRSPNPPRFRVRPNPARCPRRPRARSPAGRRVRSAQRLPHRRHDRL